MARLRRRPPARTCDVLVVCTANLCRSPYLAALLRSGLPGLEVDSAGVVPARARDTNPLLTPLLAERGIDQPVDSPSRLTAARVRGARLIVTAAHEHRLAVVHLDPAAASRTVTIKELARYLAESSPRGLEAVLAVVADAVAREHEDERDDDLADPYGLLPEAYRQMAATLDPLVAVVVAALRTTP